MQVNRNSTDSEMDSLAYWNAYVLGPPKYINDGVAQQPDSDSSDATSIAFPLHVCFNGTQIRKTEP